MILKKIIAAVIAVSTAIIPFSEGTLNVFTPLNAYSEEAADVSSFPDWIPQSFNDAVDFRNRYGAVHIGDENDSYPFYDSDLLCVVFQEPSYSTKKYEIKNTGGFVTVFYHNVFVDENTDTAYEVWTYKNAATSKPDFKVQFSCDSELQNEYSFTSFGTQVVETDIYSWLPDCNSEYIEYFNSNTNLSVKDNYVVFCISDSTDSAYECTLYDSGKECFELEAASDCRRIAFSSPDGGTSRMVYAYKAVKDGYAKIEYDCGLAGTDRKDKKQITADCAVIDGAQTILLSGEMRVTLVDYDTGEKIIFTRGKNPTIWTNTIYKNIMVSTRSATYTSKVSAPTGPFFTLETNPAILDNYIGHYFNADSFSFGLEENYLPEGYSFIDDEKEPGYYDGEIIPENSMTVTRYDNDSADVVFKLKYKPTGDVNDDGDFNVADVVLLQKWLLGSADIELINWKAADFCNDNVLNVFDLCLMRKSLIQTIKTPSAVSINETGGVAGANILYEVYQDGEKYILSYANHTKNRDAEPLIIPISEEDYRDIMSQSYTSYIEALSAPKRWSEVDFSITLSFEDGNEKKSSSDVFPSVLTKLRELLDNYQNGQA